MKHLRTTRSSRHLLIVLTAAAAVSAACGSDGASSGADSSAASPVVATTTIWADVTSQVLCGEVEVSPLIPQGTDAHTFEPSVQDADALRSAQLVVANGLGLEEGLHDSLESAEADGVTVLEVAPELTPLAAEDEHAADEHAEGGDEHAAEEEHAEDGDEHASEDEHGHGDEDPHVWMDPERVAEAVPLIAAAAADLDDLGVTAEQIDECANAYVAELQSLSAEMSTTLAAVPGAQRKLVTNHEALAYFADRFDFTVVGAVIPSTSSLGESNPRELDELAETMRDQGVQAVFAETTGATELADALADQVGGSVQVVELFTESLGDAGSGAASYTEMMSTNAERVAGALGAGAGSGAN
jgi:zinc/manganese transport system substrate-binding protein